MQKRVRVAVSVSYGFKTPDMTTIVAIKCANVGESDVNFTSCGLSLPNDQNVLFIRTQYLPKMVAARDSVTEVEILDDLKQSLARHGYTGKVPAFGYVDDAVGKRHRSKRPVLIEV